MRDHPSFKTTFLYILRPLFKAQESCEQGGGPGLSFPISFFSCRYTIFFCVCVCEREYGCTRVWVCSFLRECECRYVRVCMCVGRESLLKCFDAKVVYARKNVPPTPTSLFDMGRQPSSINLSFIRLFVCSFFCSFVHSFVRSFFSCPW